MDIEELGIGRWHCPQCGSPYTKKLMEDDEMSEQGKLVDYSEEAKELTSGKGGGNWFNPKAGNFEIEFLSEMYEKQREFQGKPQLQYEMSVKVTGMDPVGGTEYNEKELQYSCTKAQSYKSQAGQLVLMAKANDGKLRGIKTPLIVTSDGKRRTFIFTTAQKLVNDRIKKEKEDARSVGQLDTTTERVK